MSRYKGRSGAKSVERDVARNLERFVDAIVARTGPHAVVGSSPPRPTSR